MIVGVCADRRSSLPRTACNLDIEGRCAALSFRSLTSGVTTSDLSEFCWIKSIQPVSPIPYVQDHSRPGSPGSGPLARFYVGGH
jgi:hypothetical protein